MDLAGLHSKATIIFLEFRLLLFQPENVDKINLEKKCQQLLNDRV